MWAKYQKLKLRTYKNSAIVFVQTYFYLIVVWDVFQRYLLYVQHQTYIGL